VQFSSSTTMEWVCSSAAQQLWRECAAQQLNNSSSFENLAPDSQPQVKKLDLSPLVRIAKEYSGTLYSSSSSSSSSQRCKCKSTQKSGCFPQAENWVASEQAWPIRTELQNAQKKLGMCKLASKLSMNLELYKNLGNCFSPKLKCSDYQYFSFAFFPSSQKQTSCSFSGSRTSAAAKD